MRVRWLNLLGFYLGWSACVAGAAWGSAWLGPVLVGLLLALNLGFRGLPRGELKLIAVTTALGFILDSLLGFFGLISFSATPFPAWLSPPWMTALWTNFSLTLNSSLSWLGARPRLAAVLGGVGGPLSYYAGLRWGVIEFGTGLIPSLAVLAFLWAAVVPFLFVLARKVRT